LKINCQLRSGIASQGAWDTILFEAGRCFYVYDVEVGLDVYCWVECYLCRFVWWRSLISVKAAWTAWSSSFIKQNDIDNIPLNSIHLNPPQHHIHKNICPLRIK
jgi:hypothetical protein